MILRADVVVVGAGPAGSITALLIARAGFDVILLDRDRFPRAKPCGDCLSPRATRLFDELGLLPDVLATAPALLEGWRIVSPGGHGFEGRFCDIARYPLESTALAMPRFRLDAALVACARGAGVRIVQGARVTNLTASGVEGRLEGEPFRAGARLIVGADGLRSIVARRMGGVARPARLRKVSLTAHVTGLDADPSLGEMHTAPGLCAGVAPVTVNRNVACNLTIVADANRFGRAIARDAPAFFTAALARFPGLAGRYDAMSFLDASMVPAPSPVLLASGPFDVPVRRATAAGIALVGDAAGYYDPFTGQGICHALACARVLAAEAVPGLHRGTGPVPVMRGYERRRHELARGPRFVQHMIEFVLSRPWLADAAMRRLADSPDARNTLLAVTGDLAPARSVFMPRTMLGLAGIRGGGVSA